MKLLLVIGLLGLFIASCTEEAKEEENWDGPLVGAIEPEDTVKVVDPSENFDTYLESVKALGKFDGMEKIESSNLDFTAGDTLLEGSDDYSTEMFTVRLDYDFYIDADEVTQAEYYAIMGEKDDLPPSYGTNRVWKSMSQPVGRVTLYNALVFCNKRSVLAGLDEVYTITGDADAFTVTIDYSKEGYALPTSSEWEFVAHTLIIAKEADYQNSKFLVYGSKEEPKSSKSSESISGISNLFGNVKEICLSNMVTYNSDPILNHGITTFSSGSTDSYVVKGGSYKSSLSKIHPSYRQEVEIGAKLDDIGIRCVVRLAVSNDQSVLELLPEPEVDDTTTVEEEVTDTTSI